MSTLSTGTALEHFTSIETREVTVVAASVMDLEFEDGITADADEGLTAVIENGTDMEIGGGVEIDLDDGLTGETC